MSSKVQSRGTVGARARERKRERLLCPRAHMDGDGDAHADGHPTFNNWAIRYLLGMNWIINGVCDYG